MHKENKLKINTHRVMCTMNMKLNYEVCSFRSRVYVHKVEKYKKKMLGQ